MKLREQPSQKQDHSRVNQSKTKTRSTYTHTHQYREQSYYLCRSSNLFQPLHPPLFRTKMGEAKHNVSIDIFQRAYLNVRGKDKGKSNTKKPYQFMNTRREKD